MARDEWRSVLVATGLHRPNEGDELAEVIGDQHFGPIGDARYAAYAKDIAQSARHALAVVDATLSGSETGGEAELMVNLDPAGFQVRADSTYKSMADVLAADHAALMPALKGTAAAGTVPLLTGPAGSPCGAVISSSTPRPSPTTRAPTTSSGARARRASRGCACR
mgnify:CR=1 FL=1